MESRQAKYTLGSLSHIEAKTFGEPGRRTFQLVIEGGSAYGTVWLEKELLFQLGLRLQEATQNLGSEDRARPSKPVDAEWRGDPLSLDFKAGQLSLVHDVDNNSFGLSAYEVEAEESTEEASSVSFWITTEQASTLAEEALRICAAGRPSCFLCGLPINPEGHVCPRSNGHTVFESG
jgi:uncharacterized repeat protein (TIGR03847 family)